MISARVTIACVEEICSLKFQGFNVCSTQVDIRSRFCCYTNENLHYELLLPCQPLNVKQ